MKNTQLVNTAKTSDVNYMHVQKQNQNDDCCSRDRVRAGRGSPCAVQLPFYMAASPPKLNHPTLLHVLSLHFTSSRFSFSPPKKTKSSSHLRF